MKLKNKIWEIQNNTKKAFTLAEVLITLGIIGVVAALTIPVLYQKYQDMEFRTAAKKAFAVFAQAVDLAKQDNGGNGLPSYYYTSGHYFKDAIKIKMNLGIDCTGANGDCSVNVNPPVTNINGYTAYFYGDDGQFYTPDGVFWGFDIGSDFMYFDVNGLENGPNRYGRDLYVIQMLNDKPLPMGAPSTTYPASSYCVTGGSASNTAGYGCLYYVLQNINYATK